MNWKQIKQRTLLAKIKRYVRENQIESPFTVKRGFSTQLKLGGSLR